MKTALLLIPEITESIDRQDYLLQCIDKMNAEDYMSLSPGVYDVLFKINSWDFIEKTLPICDAVFFFVDFGIDAFMFSVIDRLLGKVPFMYRRLGSSDIKRLCETPDQILQKVSEKTGLSVEDLKSKSRKREICDARKVYFRRCRETTHSSYEQIGNAINRDHSTAVYGERQAFIIDEIEKLYDKIYGETKVKTAPVAKDSEPISEAERQPVTRPVLPFRSMDKREQVISGGESFVSALSGRGYNSPFSGYRPHNS